MIHSHTNLIKALGGGKAVAEQLSSWAGETVRPMAVWQWRRSKTGIPYRWRPFIERMASEAGIAVPEDFLLPSKTKDPGEELESSAA